MKQYILSTKTIILLPLVLFFIITLNIIYTYYDNERNINDFALQQAQTLNSFIVVHRDYYQKLYLDKIIPLDEKTLVGVPAFSALEISKTFSKENIFDITVETVSNNPRNPKNQADEIELKAIEFFNKNPEIKEYFEKEVDFFQYATPIFIESKCLVCHGSKENAPSFISEKYDNAYDFEVGELKGIVSIKIPTNKVSQYFTNTLYKKIIFDFFTILILFLVAMYLIRYFKNLSHNLHDEIKEKTKELSKNIAFLRSYKLAMDESNIVTKSDLSGKITYANENFYKISGYNADEVIGKDHNIIKHPDTDKELFKNLWETIRAKKVWKGVFKNRGKYGDFWLDATIIPILDDQDKVTEYIAVRHDITEVKNQKKQLETIANTDTLTGYGNRYKLTKDIKASTKPAIALLDIDKFSQVNDFYGHEKGDEIIVKLGKIIEELIIDKNFELYHLQGDEYVILAKNIKKEQFIENMIHLTNQIKYKSIYIQEQEIILNITTALSFESNENILATADIALKVAKKTKKHLLVYSDENSLNKEYENNLKWINKIKKAIDEDKIIPVFQPIINNSTKKCEKYESLVRLIDDDGSLISPFFFLDISKQTKQYTKITKIMIQKTFEIFQHKDIEFSINLTIEDILDDEIQEFMFVMLETYKIGKRVVFEIVESESINNFTEIQDFIASVKKYKCKVAIDDFGTGYSNFEYLLRLNVDYIKIDGSMIKEIDTDINKQLVVGSIVDFAHKMNIKTIAEFVENESILKVVKELGIDFSQGYYYGKPEIDVF